MAKGEKLNEEAAMNNNLSSSSLKYARKFSEELGNWIEQTKNSKKQKRD